MKLPPIGKETDPLQVLVRVEELLRGTTSYYQVYDLDFPAEGIGSWLVSKIKEFNPPKKKPVEKGKKKSTQGEILRKFFSLSYLDRCRICKSLGLISNKDLNGPGGYVFERSLWAKAFKKAIRVGKMKKVEKQVDFILDRNKQESRKPGIHLSDVEDEMLVFHRDGKHWMTLHAPSPADAKALYEWMSLHFS